MLKKNNKGFMLIETLLVSVFVASTLIFLYIQFQKVRDSYQTTFAYNTVPGTYNANTFLKYLQENGIENLSKTIDSGTVLIDLTTCPGGYLSNTALCNKMISELGIKKVYYLSSDTTNFLTRINNISATSKFKKFVRDINVKNKISYRLLFEFDNETYATILARSSLTPPKPEPTPVPTPTPPAETEIRATCMGGNSNLIWSSDCLLVSPSISNNSNYTSSNSIIINAPFMPNTRYKIEVTDGSGKFVTSMSGAPSDLSYNVYPGMWNSSNGVHTFNFNPTTQVDQIYLGNGGAYILAEVVNGMSRIITIKVYKIN